MQLDGVDGHDTLAARFIGCTVNFPSETLAKRTDDATHHSNANNSTTHFGSAECDVQTLALTKCGRG